MGILSSSGLPIESSQLQVNLVQHAATTVGTVTINPRWNDSTADSFTFDSVDDYAPSAAAGGNAYYDFELPMYTHTTNWYNYTHDNNAGRRSATSATAISDINRMSIYAQLGVGDSPHPGFDYSYTRIAILKNHPGANHQYITSGPTPNYSEPRTLADGNSNYVNFKVSGQYYAGGAYGGWYCLAHYQSNLINTATSIRIINLGGNTDARSRLRVIDLVCVLHGRLGSTGM